MLKDRCPLRKTELPAVPCDAKKCDWYIHGTEYSNCFWVLANALTEFNVSLSIEEIATLENISEEEVQNIIETALLKCRKEMKNFIKKI